jgi:hypothetical protein
MIAWYGLFFECHNNQNMLFRDINDINLDVILNVLLRVINNFTNYGLVIVTTSLLIVSNNLNVVTNLNRKTIFKMYRGSWSATLRGIVKIYLNSVLNGKNRPKIRDTIQILF